MDLWLEMGGHCQQPFCVPVLWDDLLKGVKEVALLAEEDVEALKRSLEVDAKVSGDYFSCL